MTNNLINSNKGRLIKDVKFRLKALIIELTNQRLNKQRIIRILIKDNYSTNDIEEIINDSQ